MLHPKGEFIWFFFAPMALCMGFGFFFLVKNLRIIATYEKTVGTVADYSAFNDTWKDRDGLSENIQTFGLNAIFQAKNGQYYGVSSFTRTSWQSMKIGDQVPVYYLASNPKHAYLGTFLSFWLHIATLLFIGTILLLVWYQSWMHTPEELYDVPTATQTHVYYGSGSDRKE